VTYFDTGYLAKCYLQEKGSRTVRALAAELGHIACSAYGRMELHAAFHRKVREDALSRSQLGIILRQLDLDESRGLWTWLPLSEALMDAVSLAFRTLPATVFLRTGDALHLATARQHAFHEIYTGDTHLIAAAPHFGLAARSVADPGA
jgi:predicted nucleic acid-binding protein